MWRGGDNDDVAGTVVWRKVESPIDMCRAADRITLLEHVFRNSRKGCWLLAASVATGTA